MAYSSGKVSNIKVTRNNQIIHWWKMNSVNDEGLNDEDFYTFWYSVCHLFAMLYRQGVEFLNISSDNYLVRRFLDIFRIKHNASDDISLLYNSWVSQIRDRGTSAITRYKNTSKGVCVKVKGGTTDFSAKIRNSINLGNRYSFEFDCKFDENTPGVVGIKYGYLYNWYAAVDSRNIAPLGWRVPTWDDLLTLMSTLGGAGVAGGKLKESGTSHWNTPNTGATNEVGFNGRGGGLRGGGGFTNIMNYGYVMSTTEYDPTYTRNIVMQYNDASIGYSTSRKGSGLSMRWIKEDSIDPGTIIGNNGVSYSTVKIGDQVWTASNVVETKYRNGDTIPEVTGNTAWNALTTGALCAYNNDYSNVYGTGAIGLSGAIFNGVQSASSGTKYLVSILTGEDPYATLCFYDYPNSSIPITLQISSTKKYHVKIIRNISDFIVYVDGVLILNRTGSLSSTDDVIAENGIFLLGKAAAASYKIANIKIVTESTSYFYPLNVKSYLLYNTTGNNYIIITPSTEAGLSDIFKNDDLFLNNALYSGVDGEMLRLISNISSDEMIFPLVEGRELAWNLNNSSPQSIQTYPAINFNKFYNTQESISTLEKIPIYASPFNESSLMGAEIVSNYGGRGVDVIKFTFGTSMAIGVGNMKGGDSVYSVEDIGIRVSEYLDYEISFRIHIDSTNLGLKIQFSPNCYDEDYTVLDPVSAISESDSEVVFINESVTGIYNNFIDKDLWIRAKLYNSSKVVGVDTTTIMDLSSTRNLIMKSGTKYIAPSIIFSNTSDPSPIYIWDIQVRPLDLNTSKGNLNTSDVFLPYIVNNSVRGEEEIDQFTRNNLIPYNSLLKIKYLGDFLTIQFTKIKYGLLYNQYAVDDSRGIAPEGWHIPSQIEWQTLIDYIGGATVAGGKLKETGLVYWNDPNTGATNQYSFNARGAGYRYGAFKSLKTHNSYWTSTDTMLFTIINSSDDIAGGGTFKVMGCSIRCIKDDSSNNGFVVDVDGNTYKTVKIGTQVWMVNNLIVTKYRNGDIIPNVTNQATWDTLTTGALCAYNNDNFNI